MTVRFIHTSDWQLGLKLAYLPEARRPRAQLARFQAVERIAELAAEHDVQAVVVAGDVFDDNAVGRDVLQQARDALAKFGDRPVLLMPGNHDPALPDAALARLDAGPHVRVLDAAEPETFLDGVVFYPCPATSRDPKEDPTGWIPAGASPDVVRVAVVHGAAIDFSEEADSPRLIDLERLLDRGVDYVAFGDWHGLLSLRPNVWYCGAPEATRFKEKDPGKALLVEIDGPGETPRVTPLEVSRTRWLREKRSLDSPADLDALEAWIDGLPERSWTLVELSLEGALSYGDIDRLDQLLERSAEELLWLKIRRNDVLVEPTAEDLDRLSADGFVGEAAEALRVAAEPADDEGARAAQDALRLLYRFLRKEEGR